MVNKNIGQNMEVYEDDMLIKKKTTKENFADLKGTFETLQKYKMKPNFAKCTFGVSLGKFLSFIVSQWGIEANLEKMKAVLEMMSPKIVKEVQRLTSHVAALNRFVSKL